MPYVSVNKARRQYCRIYFSFFPFDFIFVIYLYRCFVSPMCVGLGGRITGKIACLPTQEIDSGGENYQTISLSQEVEIQYAEPKESYKGSFEIFTL